MKVMIKTELERAFKSWSLWLALIIGMGLSIAQIITRIIPAAMNPLMGYMPGGYAVCSYISVRY